MPSVDWIPLSDAPERVGRSKRTVYDWLADPALEIRTMRPARAVWVNLPDLLRVEASKRPGRPKTRHSDPAPETPQMLHSR